MTQRWIIRWPAWIRKGNREKRSDATRFLLTGRSGGSDRMLPPSVRSIPERSNSFGIATGHVRWSMTGRRQGPVSLACSFFKRLDAGSLPDRTHKRSIRSLLQLLFTSCELIERWTTESGHSFPANLQSSFALPVPNQVPTRIRSK